MIKKFAQLSFILCSISIPHLLFAQQKEVFGRYKSRAIYTPADVCPAPLVILVPGSGPNGPEEMIPASMTGDGLDHSIFNSYSRGLRRAQVATLAIGKPGVDFFKSWELKDLFYDLPLYQNLGWQDLINNLSDAVTFAKNLPCVDHQRLSVLGHSEGTQVAVDFALQSPLAIKNLILVGFQGESMATTLEWQLFRRDIDAWLRLDADKNQDGQISRREAADWPEFTWDWKPSQNQVSFDEIEQMLRGDEQLNATFAKAKLAKIWRGVFNRPPLYDDASRLTQNIFVFTGELDVQTRPEEALKLKAACVAQKKLNCEVTIVPGLGHALSLPNGPRRQKLLDATLGPVENSFIDRLGELGQRL